MVSGGARGKSGPAPDPASGRSERRGFKLTALPAGGYDGEAPAFPLARYIVVDEYSVGEGSDRSKVREPNESASYEFQERELDVWAEAWSTPQAAAWARESWRWPVVAEYCRLKVVIELDPAKSAALVGQLHRYRDQIGLSPAGLSQNGWGIAPDEVGQRREERAATPKAERTAPARRLRGV